MRQVENKGRMSGIEAAMFTSEISTLQYQFCDWKVERELNVHDPGKK